MNDFLTQHLIASLNLNSNITTLQTHVLTKKDFSNDDRKTIRKELGNFLKDYSKTANEINRKHIRTLRKKPNAK